MSELILSSSLQVVDIDPTSESTFPGITEMREVLEVSQSKICALSHLMYMSVYLSGLGVELWKVSHVLSHS